MELNKEQKYALLDLLKGEVMMSGLFYCNSLTDYIKLCHYGLAKAREASYCSSDGIISITPEGIVVAEKIKTGK